MNYSILIDEKVILLTGDLVNGTNFKTMINNQKLFDSKIIDYIQKKCEHSFPSKYIPKQTLIRIRISLNIINYLYHYRPEYSLLLDQYLAINIDDYVLYDSSVLQRYYILFLLVDLLDVDKRILYSDVYWMKNINELQSLMSQFHKLSSVKYPLLADSVKTSVEQMITFNYPISTNAFYTTSLNEKENYTSNISTLETLFSHLRLLKSVCSN